MGNRSTAIDEISLEGFKIVSGDLFMHAPRRSCPTCTIWRDSIGFSKRAVEELNTCERIRIQVHPDKRCILIVPVTMNDKDGIRWIKNTKEPAARKMTCKSFTSQLFEVWGLDPRCAYRANGRVVTSDHKVMLLFDFLDPETWTTPVKEES